MMVQGRIIELEELTATLSHDIQQLKDEKESLSSRNRALVRLAEQKTWQLEHAKTSVSHCSQVMIALDQAGGSKDSPFVLIDVLCGRLLV